MFRDKSILEDVPLAKEKLSYKYKVNGVEIQNILELVCDDLYIKPMKLFAFKFRLFKWKDMKSTMQCLRLLAINNLSDLEYYKKEFEEKKKFEGPISLQSELSFIKNLRGILKYQLSKYSSSIDTDRLI